MYTLVVHGLEDAVSALLNSASNVDYSQILPIPPYLLARGAEGGAEAFEEWQRIYWQTTKPERRTEKWIYERDGKRHMAVRFDAPSFPESVLLQFCRYFPSVDIDCLFVRDVDVRDRDHDRVDIYKGKGRMHGHAENNETLHSKMLRGSLEDVITELNSRNVQKCCCGCHKV
jgi:hypothetical protein